MKYYFKPIVVLVFLFSITTYSQQKTKPKLIVGIVIDQMRAEYLYRFQENYTENGFKRLMQEGFNVKNTHYNYIPTETGPGHTSIYTGTTPANHGIVSNYWYDRDLKKNIYCAEDNTVYLVDNKGINKEVKYKNFSRSPKHNLTTTITDELKLFTNNRSKVIGIPLKDRGAILPAGNMADYAFWFNHNNGHFVTSSFYNQELPNWLIKFNDANLSDSFLKKTWNLLLPIEKYRNSNPDDSPYERIYKGKEKSTFPYSLNDLNAQNGGYNLIMQTPLGNSLLTKFAEATIKGECLGKNSDTDFLAISYSSTDKVGHDFGIRSKELEDTYLRLDREISKLLKILDREVGKGNYTLFLTADHAGSDNPKYLESVNIPGKFYDPKKIETILNDKLSKDLGVKYDYITYMNNTQIYVDYHNFSKITVLEKMEIYLDEIDGIKHVFAPTLRNQSLNNSLIGSFVKNSYNPTNSGDIIYQMQSGWMSRRAYGTSHGTSYTSDTHVPLLWYGFNIPKGESVNYHRITQIAPTLSLMFNIPLPNTSNLYPIKEIFD